MADLPPFLHPFVLPTEPARRHRDGAIDVFTRLSQTERPRAVVVFVHGGPLPPEVTPRPRDWPVFQGYGALAAAAGLVAVTLDHRLHTIADYDAATRDVASAVEHARGLVGVDPDNVALWIFSGGGPLSAEYLAAPPPWLRCLALTYPLLGCPPEFDPEGRFNAVDAVATAPDLPILLTRVGHELPDLARLQDSFVETAKAKGARLEIIEVPNGQHGFDNQDHTEESRAAVRQAMTWVVQHTLGSR
jgi:acetyl esterase/lipase